MRLWWVFKTSVTDLHVGVVDVWVGTQLRLEIHHGRHVLLRGCPKVHGVVGIVRGVPITIIRVVIWYWFRHC